MFISIHKHRRLHNYNTNVVGLFFFGLFKYLYMFTPRHAESQIQINSPKSPEQKSPKKITKQVKTKTENTPPVI